MIVCELLSVVNFVCENFFHISVKNCPGFHWLFIAVQHNFMVNNCLQVFFFFFTLIGCPQLMKQYH